MPLDELPRRSCLGFGGFECEPCDHEEYCLVLDPLLLWLDRSLPERLSESSP